MRIVLIVLLGVASLVAGEASAVDAPSAEDAVEDGAALRLSEPPLFDPPAEAEAEALSAKIASGLRCPVCQGLSVADSNADAARAMYARISELVDLGYSEEQIVDYFVGRYGGWVRLEPPREGLNWLIWVGPVVLFVGGAMVASRQVRGASDGPNVGTDGAASPPPLGSGGASYRDQVLAELAGTSPEVPPAELPSHRDRVLAELESDRGDAS